MAKDPATLFYVSDFLTGTILMSNEQVGIYIRLLCVQHQHDGVIEKISFNNIVGEHKIIRCKFIETDDGFYNKRMMEEMVKRQKKSESLSANAMIRWNKEKEKQCKSNANAHSKHMPIRDRDKDINKDNKVVFDFEPLWKEYPSTIGKKQAEKHFKASVLTHQDYEDIKKALVNYKKSERVRNGYIQNGSTWFNNWHDWLDFKEPTITKPKEDSFLLQQAQQDLSKMAKKESIVKWLEKLPKDKHAQLKAFLRKTYKDGESTYYEAEDDYSRQHIEA